MPVDTTHPLYNKWLPIWTKTRDAIAGEDQVKSKTTIYLPKLGKDQDQHQYNAYLKRALFHPFTGKTLEVSIGQLFRKPPTGTEALGDLEGNIDLSGENFSAFSRHVASEILSVNRVGILVSYSEKQTRAYSVVYEAEQIINWETGMINGVKKTTMIMLYGTRQEKDPLDPYVIKSIGVWKELYLDENGIYQTRDWEKGKVDGKEGFVQVADSTPIKNDKTMTEIPFYVLTSAGITTDIEKSPLLGMANVNFGHYRNSASNENMLHWTGVPTVIARGWPKGETFPLGGVAGFNSVDGGADYLQAQSDTGLDRAMTKKEAIMAMLGTQLLSGKGRYVQSAQTAEITSQGEFATLSDVAGSMSSGMSTAMSFMMDWQNDGKAEIPIEYNTDYQAVDIPSGRILELGGAKNSGDISPETYFYNLKKYEMYPVGLTYEQDQADIEKAGLAAIAKMDAKAKDEVDELFSTPVDQNNDV